MMRYTKRRLLTAAEVLLFLGGIVAACFFSRWDIGAFLLVWSLHAANDARKYE